MNFEWELEEESENRDPRSFQPSPAPNPRRWGRLLFGVLLVAVLAALSWWRISLYDQETEQFLQSAVDLQVSAVLNRDGDLYFTNYGAQPNLTIHNMHPLQMNFWLSQPEIVSYEQIELEIWARAKWSTAENETLYRTLFFNDWNGSVRLKEESKAFWGEVSDYENLFLTNRDWDFRDQLVARTNSILEKYCDESYPTDCDEITVRIGPQTFLPSDDFELLSPHLYGLTARGDIPDSYWIYFDQRLIDLLGRAPIRFGIPELQENSAKVIAAEFEETEAGRHISVEIVPYDPETVDFVEFLKSVDGAFLPPSLDLVTAGSLMPVTELAHGMHTDMFGQHWAAAWWQDQMWFLPIDGELSFISTDGNYAARYGRPDAAYPNWTWDEFDAVMDVYTIENGLNRGIATPNVNLLLSRAYQHDHTCTSDVSPMSCSIDLSTEGVAEALDFYQQNHEQISIPPAGTVHQQLIHFTTQASVSAGHSAMWLSRPRLYEHDLSTRAAYVQPLPRTENSDPIYPLAIRGGAISSFSDAPVSTWAFIDWLSQQEFSSAERAIPARFRTMVDTRFWDKLPVLLRPKMEEAFAQSRPIRLGEAERLRPEILSQVAAGELTPAEAAAIRQTNSWFRAYFPEQQQAN